MSPRKPDLKAGLKPPDGLGKLPGKRFAKSYWEEQQDMHKRNEEENVKWEKAKQKWKQGYA